MDVFELRANQAVKVSEEVEELAVKVIGAAIEVHRHLGPGLPEIAYRNALFARVEAEKYLSCLGSRRAN